MDVDTIQVNQRRFVQRLPNVFQTSMAFGTRWAVVVQTSLVPWDDFYPQCNSDCHSQ